jgi:hypothetical protein
LNMRSLALVLLLLEIAGYVYLFRKLFSLPVVVAPAVYVCATIICLYISDFLGLLWYARLTIHVVGWAAFAYLAYSWIIRPSKSIRSALRAERKVAAICAIFVVFAFVALYANGNLLFWKWDEFSHWGAVIRAISEADTFHLKPNPLMFPDYPVATALFAYHVLGLTGYSEGIALVSIDIVLLAFLMPIVANSFSANFLFGLVITSLIYIFVIVFSHGWDSVNIDHVISVTFAGAVAVYLTIGVAPASLVALPLILATLALMKQSGVYVALIVAAICAADMIIRQLLTRPGVENGAKGRRFRFVHLVWIIAIFAAPLLMDASWKAYMRANNIDPLWGKIGSSAPALLKCCETDREVTVTNAYFEKYFAVPKGEQVKGTVIDIAKDKIRKIEFKAGLPTTASSIFAMFGFLVLSWLGISLLLNKGSDRWRAIAMIAIISGGMIAYSASLLSTYVYIFHIYDATNVASFDRYLNTYILAAFLIAFFWIGMTIAGRSPAVRWAAALLFAVWGFHFTYPAQASLRQYRPERAQGQIALRLNLRGITEPAIRQIPPDKKVYVGWLDTSGTEFMVIRYELMPRVTNTDCFSVVAGPPMPVMETCVLSETAFSKSLAPYDYFILGQGHARMKQDYPSIWDQGISDNVTLFRIDKSGTLVKMIPMSR